MNPDQLQQFYELVTQWLEQAEVARQRGDRENELYVLRTRAYGQADALEMAADSLASVLLSLGRESTQTAPLPTDVQIGLGADHR